MSGLKLKAAAVWLELGWTWPGGLPVPPSAAQVGRSTDLKLEKELALAFSTMYRRERQDEVEVGATLHGSERAKLF